MTIPRCLLSGHTANMLRRVRRVKVLPIFRLLVSLISFARSHQPLFASACGVRSSIDILISHRKIRGGGDSIMPSGGENNNVRLLNDPTEEAVMHRRKRLERRDPCHNLAAPPSTSFSVSKDQQKSLHFVDKGGNERRATLLSGTLHDTGSSSKTTEINFDSLLDYDDIDSIKYNPLKMYKTCLIIVFIWVFTGTTFYSFVNDWPFPQSFFYAIDAGMSIGFCTDVYETKLISKAFTVIYILLGASCVGGALALFIQDAVEGLVDAHRVEYLRLLEQEEHDLLMAEGRGECLQDQNTLEPTKQHTPPSPTHSSSYFTTQKAMTLKDYIKNSIFVRYIAHWLTQLECAWKSNHRIYIVFVLWIALGIGWGMVDQKWDIITASHFAVSALATGGLTAPPVNEMGILPAEPAIFCGTYCLFGIPLFALTLGHFARVLVQDHVIKAEVSSIQRKLTPAEFEYASKKLLSPHDNVMHLSDFVVLQLLRQGKITPEVVTMMRKRFERLDVDGVRTLNLERATSSPPASRKFASE